MLDDFGSRLRRLRMGKKLSVEELSRIVEIPAPFLTQLENNSIKPWEVVPDWMFGALAIALDVSKSSLILHCREAKVDAENDRRYPVDFPARRRAHPINKPVVPISHGDTSPTPTKRRR